jgi:hypothetical protein
MKGSSLIYTFCMQLTEGIEMIYESLSFLHSYHAHW